MGLLMVPKWFSFFIIHSSNKTVVTYFSGFYFLLPKQKIEQKHLRENINGGDSDSTIKLVYTCFHQLVNDVCYFIGLQN